MIKDDEYKRICEYIKKKSTADDFAFSIDSSDKLYVRFAQNAITQNITGKNIRLRLNVAFDNKTGEAYTNQTDKNSIGYLISTAERLAWLNKPDPEFVPSESYHELPPAKEPAEATLQLTERQIIDEIEKCVRNAEQKKARVFGLSNKVHSKRYLFTKNGFEGWNEQAYFSQSMTMAKDKVETKVSKSIKDFSQFSIEDLISELNEQFDSLQDPQQMEKGRIPVILRPAAVLDWLLYIVWTFDLRNADEGITPYTNQLGKKFFGEKFSLMSDSDDIELMAERFDDMGVPNYSTNWITQGIIENMQVSRWYARHKGIEPKSVFNIEVAGEDFSESELMNMVKRGVIVNRFWYIRPVDMRTGEWTGLTRDGVRYFENGEVLHTVTNFRWNEIFHDATRRLLGLGKSIQQEHYAKIPSMLIDDFNFVDVTTF
jgi:predicted Zn-dependent protease